MRFSLFCNWDYPPGASFPTIFDHVEQQAIAAEKAGFLGLWIAEHHFGTYGCMPTPLMFLSRLSGRTERLLLGTAITQLPHYNAVRLAEDICYLDAASNGRLRIGAGTGAKEKEKELEAFGVPAADKLPRTLETLEILGQALDAGHIDFKGDFYELNDISVAPPPSRPARELLSLTGRSLTGEAARRGYGLLVPRTARAEARAEFVQSYLDAPGGTRGPIISLRFVFVADTEREALERTRRTVVRYANDDLGVRWDGEVGTPVHYELLDRLNFAVGTPEQIIARIEEWGGEFPADEYACHMFAAGMRHEDVLRSIELFGREVIGA
ncbi:LLM class flavin-dependent oxidoreductase [Actinomadura monticuli]|uniref:LLM class flavin-dependent oxidoreductase n=1 Tax=Actinomadura monticuli TaxID=3097367 RepID=A0ABV4Q4N3_9ACTN